MKHETGMTISCKKDILKCCSLQSNGSSNILDTKPWYTYSNLGIRWLKILGENVEAIRL